MSYAEYRLELIKAFYRFQLKEFLKGFKHGQPAIILLPGGMGSELDRTHKRFPKEPNTFDERVWVDIDISNGDALKLEIDPDQRDLDAFVIAANGRLHFFTLTPYDDFLRFAKNKGWNIVVFGYDWRRPIKESADLLRLFVKEFQSSVRAISGKDPLPRTTFVCHSMGGMVVTLALRESGFSALAFNAVVTVATPFYGTSDHHERYYVGQKPLNDWYPKSVITRVIGSMNGPFPLLFLPKTVFADYGEKIGLAKYPLTDSKTGEDADPFDSGVATRWPTYVRVEGLPEARAAMIAVAKPVAAGVLGRFFNVRSQLDKKTAVALRWDDVDGTTFDPDTAKNPLHRVLGPGDGTVPFWSAFHASTIHRIELHQARDHGNLLEHPEVMGVVERIVTKGKSTSPGRKAIKAGGRAAPKASDQRLRAVLKSAQRRRKAGKPMPAALFEKAVARALFSKLIW